MKSLFCLIGLLLTNGVGLEHQPGKGSLGGSPVLSHHRCFVTFPDGLTRSCSVPEPPSSSGNLFPSTCDVFSPLLQDYV